MSQSRITTKAELLTAIERNWNAFNGALDQLTDAQWTAPRHAQGWTVMDHISHMAAWERSVVFLLQGKDRHTGLGVDKTLYRIGDYDAINAAVRQQHRELSPAEARHALRDVHGQLLDLLQPLSDADLHKPYAHYLPNEPSADEGPPVINVIYANTAHHFAEHLRWIQALVD